MKQDVIRRLAARMRQQRERILADFESGEQALEHLATEQESELEDRAEEARETQLLMALDDRRRREIEDIDLALERISAGRYGSCEHCAKPIALERLDALPTTRLCAPCAGGDA
jgi:DnaK suppressor protein